MLRRGVGVERNAAKASSWYLTSAEKDYAPAQFELGRMYPDGEGLEINNDSARQWMQKAAEQDNEDAKKWLSEQLKIVN
jgi:TPR repeat protein